MCPENFARRHVKANDRPAVRRDAHVLLRDDGGATGGKLERDQPVLDHADHPVFEPLTGTRAPHHELTAVPSGSTIPITKSSGNGSDERA